MKKLKKFIVKSHYFAAYAVLALLSISVQSTDQTLQSYNAEQIEAMAQQYVENLFPPPQEGKTEYHTLPLDKRINIKPCAAPLQISIPGSATLSKQTTVLLRCPDDVGWNLYVQVRIKQMIPVVVSRTTLAPGTVISEDNVSTMMVDISQIRGQTLKEPSPLIGAKISRYVAAGQAVTLRQVCLVCKGDSVTVVAKLNGLQVKTTGISQQNGSLGDNIAILNQRTSKRIKATVVAVNRVEVNL